MIWFTADNHIGHTRVIEYSNRPFRDVDHMNTEMIARWNARVQPTDTIYILGDMCWRSANYGIEIVRQLNGIKHLVRGNHDRACLAKQAFRDLFASITDLLEIKVPDPDAPPAMGGYQRITLCHYAMLVWNHSHRGSWMLHGHSHGKLWNPNGKRLDVGADCWDYAPVSYDEIKAAMVTRSWEQVDHHAPRGE